MEEVRRDDEQVVVSASRDELRLLVGALNEALNGAYAIPTDEWEGLVGQPLQRADALLDALIAILDER